MLTYLLRRFVLLLLMLAGASLVLFALSTLSPVDPAEAAIRVNAMVPTPELIEETRRAFGLDQPFWTRYAHWATGLLRGDLGRSWATGLPVAESLAAAFPATLKLAAASLLIILGVSIPAAVASSRAQNSPFDHALRAFIFLSSSMPAFWAALLLMDLFAVEWRLLPTSGMDRPGSIILPAVSLSLAYVGTYMRLIRAEMLHSAHEDWVVFARGRGLSEARITVELVWSSLRGTAAALGMSIPKLVAGAFVIEVIFAWPGVGRLCVEAVFNRDLPVIAAYVLIMAALYGLFILASEAALILWDPRERERRLS